MFASAVGLVVVVVGLAGSCGFACSSAPAPPAAIDRPRLDEIDHSWSTKFDGKNNAALQCVAISDRRVYVAGSSRTPPGAGGFVAALDRAGRVVWTRQIGGPGEKSISALAVDAKSGGEILAAALSFTEPVLVAGQRLATSGSPATAILTIDRNGEVKRVHPLYTDQYARISALEFTADGSLVAAGMFSGTVRIGRRVVTSAGASDVFVARFAPSGKIAWAVRAGGAGADSVHGLARPGSSALVIAGSFADSAHFGDTVVTASRPLGRGASQDGYLAALDAKTGQFVRVTSFGTGQWIAAHAVAALPRGAAVVAGQFEGRLELASSLLSSQGEADGFVAMFDGSGTAQWAIRFGGEGVDQATHLAAFGSDDSSFVVAGTFAQSASFGAISRHSAGARDVFAALVTRSGNVTTVQSLGGPGQDALGAMDTTPDRAFAIAGSFEGAAEIGTSLQASGERSGFVAWFEL